MQDPNLEFTANKTTARLYGSRACTLRKTIKDKHLFGNLNGWPYSRDTLNTLGKLNIFSKILNLVYSSFQNKRM